MKNIKKIMMLWITFCMISLFGCAATQTAISKNELDVQTHMSKSIFLNPVSEDEKTVFVQVKNTSANHHIALERNLRIALAEKGYVVVKDPDMANFMIQANILHVGKVNLTEVNSALDSGFGGAIVGASLAGITGGDGRAMAGAGLAGAALGVALDAMTKDICYTIVTDVQISEREHLKLNEQPRTGSAASGKINTPSGRWKRHQTRIITTANKVNLRFEEALPELVYEVTDSIAGIV